MLSGGEIIWSRLMSLSGVGYHSGSASGFYSMIA